jgi:hypothetical protein
VPNCPRVRAGGARCSGRTEIIVVEGSGGAGPAARQAWGLGRRRGRRRRTGDVLPEGPRTQDGSGRDPDRLVLHRLDGGDRVSVRGLSRLDTTGRRSAPPLRVNTSFNGWSKIPRSTKPRRDVDWCDARAYCQWAGKRLCGRPGGGSAPFDELASPTASEWYFACSRGGKRPYPYGLTFQDWACATADNPKTGVSHVRGNWGCQGGFDDLWDMSGNVAGVGGLVQRRRRPSQNVACAGAAASPWRGHAVPVGRELLQIRDQDQWGIRCCADAVPPG